MNNITDALVYSQINNNLTPQNFTAYNELLSILGKSNKNELDEILSNTVIKKGCCEAVSPLNDSSKYETTIYSFDEKNPYKKKKVTFDKSICDIEKYYKGQKNCNDFRKLYCENSKFLYDNDDVNIEDWGNYSTYCRTYQPIEPEKKKDKDKISEGIDKATEDATTKATDDATTKKPDDATTKKTVLESEQSPPQKLMERLNEKSGLSKTAIYGIIIGSVILCILIIISIIFAISKGKN